jgi:hypothetical protein
MDEMDPSKWDASEREEQVRLAVAGDPEATALVVRHRGVMPEADERVGNPAHQALESIILQIAGSDHLRAQVIREECARYRKELLSRSPHRLERMAVDTVLVTWAYLHFLYQGSSGRVPSPPATLLKLQGEAQRCHEGALRSLELVRNKLMPADRAKATANETAAAEKKPKPAGDKEPSKKPQKLKLRRPK